MTKFDFFEKIGFFMCDKEGHQWTGKMKKAEQVKAFGQYFGKGVITVCETTMTIVHKVSTCFGGEMVISTSMSKEGFFNKFDILTPLHVVK